MKFVEERLRKQANELAKEELREEMNFIEGSNYLKASFDNRNQILHQDENDNYETSSMIFYNGDHANAINEFRQLLDKRTEEIYEGLADELLKKIGSLDFLFKECE